MSINDEDIIELFIEVEKLDKRFARRLSNRTQPLRGTAQMHPYSGNDGIYESEKTGGCPAYPFDILKRIAV